jgi:hypothetical protein
VDSERGLVGECDFILSAAPPVPALRAPLVTIEEAKRNEVESGVWQCIAQMFAAREFNHRSGDGPEVIYGCVTNAEVWQFLRLSGSVAGIDKRRYYIDNVGAILAVFQTILTGAVAQNPSKPSMRTD